MSDLVEKVYNLGPTQLRVLQHDLSGGSIIDGTREELIDAMNNLECNIDGTDTTDYDDELTNAINPILTSSNQDEKSIIYFIWSK